MDNVQTTMKVQKVVDFVSVKKSFDQDEEPSLNSKLFGSILVMDEVNIVAIICHKIIPLNKALTWVIKLYGCFEMVGVQKRSKCKESSGNVQMVSEFMNIGSRFYWLFKFHGIFSTCSASFNNIMMIIYFNRHIHAP